MRPDLIDYLEFFFRLFLVGGALFALAYFNSALLELLPIILVVLLAGSILFVSMIISDMRNPPDD